MRIKIRPADKRFSLHIRRRDSWRCQRCGTQYQEGDQGLQNAHFHGRASESTRFEPDNCDALCYGCHSYFHGHPLDHVNWKKARLGPKRFKTLEIQAHTYQRKDDAKVLLWLKNLPN